MKQRIHHTSRSRISISDDPPLNLLGCPIENSSFILYEFLTKGSFGSIFTGLDIITGSKVAIKLEPKTAHCPQLQLEYGFYRMLGTRRGIPQIYFLGTIDQYNGLVMELLGPNLGMMLEKCGGRFSLRTIVQLTIQLISLFSYIHDRGLIYRDTKPENFLLGSDQSFKWWIVHVIDLGFCKQWRLSDGSHIPLKLGKCLTGTIRYISINNHRGREQSRRDDLQALGYMLIYFFKGELPWMNIQIECEREKLEKIAYMKESIETSQLCVGMPKEFHIYMSKVMSLEFEEAPDYFDYGKMFSRLLTKRYGLEINDKVYDWKRNHQIKHIELRSI